MYRSWTNPELVKKWWGPKGVFAPVCEIDAGSGGRINIVMEAGERLGDVKGTRRPMEREFVGLVKPERIVFKSSALNDEKEIFEQNTTVTLEKVGGKTRMTVRVLLTRIINRQQAAPAISGMERGRNRQFDKLDDFPADKIINSRG